ncbi:hypothetical protein EDB80DRAFT_777985 [Ilyonectria destructans]|nr:hypothetical protein EDB80DRAFT_777985 [Ilyonectria destructans]
MTNRRGSKAQVGDNCPSRRRSRAPPNIGTRRLPHSRRWPLCEAVCLWYFSTRDISATCHTTARYLTPIPDKLSSKVAAPMLYAGMTSYAALRKSNTKPGDWMVMSGVSGSVGHLVTQLAAKAFGQRVIGIDQASKGDVVKQSGAEVFLDIMKVGQDIPAEVKRYSEGLGVIVCAASNIACAQGVDFLRPGGTMIGIGMPSGDPTPIATAMPSLIIQKQLKTFGSILGINYPCECPSFGPHEAAGQALHLGLYRQIPRTFQ